MRSQGSGYPQGTKTGMAHKGTFGGAGNVVSGSLDESVCEFSRLYIYDECISLHLCETPIKS